MGSGRMVVICANTGKEKLRGIPRDKWFLTQVEKHLAASNTSKPQTQIELDLFVHSQWKLTLFGWLSNQF